MGVNFMEDNDNIVDDIKSTVSGQPILVIFDDLIGSSSLKSIANLFTVDARHMNMSIVFLTQKCLSIVNILDKYHRIVITLQFLKILEIHLK